MKLGLRNIRVLLNHAGNPQRHFRSVHIAGTNGKGSTSSFIASMLMESGFKTGLYTSPHLIRFSERIRIDGKEIPEKRIISYVQDLAPVIEETGATFFEATTCLAFQYFADEKVDVAVIETGLGGRLDATNVLLPLVSVITSISYDHTDVLGRTIASIAREKGGIIKRGIPCITSSRDPIVLRTLDRIAARRSTKILDAGSILRIISKNKGGRERIRVAGKGWTTRPIRLGLSGEHQVENARLAAAAYEIITRQFRGPSSRTKQRCMERGLSRVTANTGLRGRREKVAHHGVRILLDVAHNPDGMRALVRSLGTSARKRFVVLCGILRDKDADGMLSSLADIAAFCVSVTPATGRALTGRELAARMRGFAIPVKVGGSVRTGLRHALKLAGTEKPLLVTGSHYVVGEVLAAIEKESRVSSGNAQV